MRSLFLKDMHKVYGKSSIGTNTLLLSPDFVVLDEDMSMKTGDKERIENVFARTVGFGDAKGADEEDPCWGFDPLKGPAADSAKAVATRGQLIDFAKAFFASGHRTACHGFVVMPSYARLIRFDHSGATFTERFDWRNTNVFADFFWALDCASPSQRGFDTSVTSLDVESAEVTDAKRILSAQASLLPHSISVQSFYPAKAPLFLFLVYDDEKFEFHRVVTSRPYVASPSFIGRDTRGYLGVDLEEKCVVFMKDAWRINLQNIPKESATYRRLASRLINEEGNKYLPDFYFGGDVPSDCPSPSSCDGWSLQHPNPTMQTSESYQYVEDDQVVRPRSDKTTKTEEIVEVYPHVHHRLLFKKIGAPLRTFRRTKELCTAIYHAILCMKLSFPNTPALNEYCRSR